MLKSHIAILILILLKNILSLIHNKIETVVVTKNPTKETILSIAKLPCSYVQIHGELFPR